MSSFPDPPPERASTLDLLDSLPDVGEFIPVNDFWQDYVQQLERAGTQPEPMEDGDVDSAYEKYSLFRSRDFSATVPPADAAMDALGGDFAAPALPGGMPPLPFPASGQDIYGVSGQPPLAVQNPALPALSAANPTFSNEMRPEAYNNSANSEDLQGEYNPYGSGNHSSTRSQSKRNAKQQQQNKQAQQRYRERRKMKFVEMESAIDTLNNQLKDLSSVKSQNAVLRGKTNELEALLKEKEQEIQALKASLVTQIPSLTEEVVDNQGGETSPQPDKLVVYQQSFEDRIGQLKIRVDELKLRELDPTGEGVAKATLSAVEEAVNNVCKACVLAAREQGIKVLELMSKDPGQIDKVTCKNEHAKWSKILELLRLTPSQQQHLLLLRSDHLTKLRECYEERQQLNMQALSLMLPRPGKAVTAPEIEGKIKCMTITGHTLAARDNVELAKVLDRIKANLSREQKAMTDINWCTMHRVLSPIQAALLLVESFPHHLDSLKLANMVAFHQSDHPSAGPCTDSCGSGGSGRSEECWSTLSNHGHATG